MVAIWPSPLRVRPTRAYQGLAPPVPWCSPMPLCSMSPCPRVCTEPRGPEHALWGRACLMGPKHARGYNRLGRQQRGVQRLQIARQGWVHCYLYPSGCIVTFIHIGALLSSSTWVHCYLLSPCIVTFRLPASPASVVSLACLAGAASQASARHSRGAGSSC